MASKLSWLAGVISHPFVAALADLASHPAIASNPAAAAAVADVTKDATAAASEVSSVPGLVADASAAADPILGAFDQAVIEGADLLILKTLGPVGQVVIPGANVILAVLEARAHALIASVFAHARAKVAAQSPPPPG